MATKAVVFDLWNTLVHAGDAQSMHRELKWKLFGRESCHPVALEDALKRTIMTKVFPTIDDLKQYTEGILCGIDYDRSALDQAGKHYKAELKRAELYPETVHVLSTLREKGFKLGLISNTSSFHVPVMDKFNLRQYFDALCFSCDVGYQKPEPEIYRACWEALRVSPKDCLMTGDDLLKDCDAPITLGMRAVPLIRPPNRVPPLYASQYITSLDGLEKYLR